MGVESSRRSWCVNGRSTGTILKMVGRGGLNRRHQDFQISRREKLSATILLNAGSGELCGLGRKVRHADWARGNGRLPPTAFHVSQKFTAGRVIISIVPRDPNSIEIFAMVLLSGASTTFT
jgi:hypothetical protein